MICPLFAPCLPFILPFILLYIYLTLILGFIAKINSEHARQKSTELLRAYFDNKHKNLKNS